MLPRVRENLSFCLYTYKSRDISLRLGGNLISVGLVKFRVIAFSISILSFQTLSVQATHEN